MNERSTPEVEPFRFDKDYFVVAVSDVHLGFHFDPSFPDPAIAFGKFIDELINPKNDHKIEHFVILGDFLDLWRRDDECVFERHHDILKDLVDMKNNKKIGELHYLVGNHDYNILWYKLYDQYIKVFSRNGRGWLKEFKVKSGSSRRAKSLKLSLRKKGKTFGFRRKKGKTFVFRHGHQDKYHNVWPFYDPICILFGTMGNTSGWIASYLWKYKFYVPLIIATGTLFHLTFFMFLSSQWLLTGIMGAISLVSLLLVLLKIKKKRSQENSINALLKEKHEEIKEMSNFEIDSFIEGILGDLGEPIPKDPDDVLIVGHTHDLVIKPVEKKYNLGAWVENAGCRILTIDHGGKVEPCKCC